jgi:DNA-binding XRE family transcriptional regulator
LRALLLAVKIARAFGTTVEDVFKFDEDETKLES